MPEVSSGTVAPLSRRVAALGRPGSMDAVTGYLGDLFREPARHRDDRSAGSALHAACATVSGQRSS